MPVLERVEPEAALDRVTAALGADVADARVNFDQVDITCQPSALRAVVSTLKSVEGVRCEFFTFLSGVDRTEFGGGEGEKAGGLEVLIHLYSPDHVIHVNIHVPVDLEDPVCPSISDIFSGALWHERETHEMFGIDFEGHPRLVNLYLPEDFEGNPLRRSFKLPSRVIKEWPGAKDPEEAAAGGR
ncbi:MAG: NADH-quinone oxidoreductase subunit C [Actinomycetota bacterium]